MVVGIGGNHINSHNSDLVWWFEIKIWVLCDFIIFMDVAKQLNAVKVDN